MHILPTLHSPFPEHSCTEARAVAKQLSIVCPFVRQHNLLESCQGTNSLLAVTYIEAERGAEKDLGVAQEAGGCFMHTLL